MDDSSKEILTAIVVFLVLIYGFFFVMDKVMEQIYSFPSETNCQRFNDQEYITIHDPHEMFCEFNQTGWHLNKTKLSEAFSNAV